MEKRPHLYDVLDSEGKEKQWINGIKGDDERFLKNFEKDYLEQIEGKELPAEY